MFLAHCYLEGKSLIFSNISVNLIHFSLLVHKSLIIGFEGEEQCECVLNFNFEIIDVQHVRGSQITSRENPFETIFKLFPSGHYLMGMISFRF